MRAPQALEGPSGRALPGPTPKPGGVAFPPNDDPDPAIADRIARLLEVGDEDEFIALALRSMERAIVDLMALIPALADDNRVKDEYKVALAAQLDYLNSEHFEEWIVNLCEGRDASEWFQPYSPATDRPHREQEVVQ